VYCSSSHENAKEQREPLRTEENYQPRTILFCYLLRWPVQCERKSKRLDSVVSKLVLPTHRHRQIEKKGSQPCQRIHIPKRPDGSGVSEAEKRGTEACALVAPRMLNRLQGPVVLANLGRRVRIPPSAPRGAEGVRLPHIGSSPDGRGSSPDGRCRPCSPPNVLRQLRIYRARGTRRIWRPFLV